MWRSGPFPQPHFLRSAVASLDRLAGGYTFSGAWPLRSLRYSTRESAVLGSNPVPASREWGRDQGREGLSEVSGS